VISGQWSQETLNQVGIDALNDTAIPALMQFLSTTADVVRNGLEALI
jgi:hypothetical protein